MTNKDRMKTVKMDALLDRAGRKAWANKLTLEEIAIALFDESAPALSELERSLMDNSLRSLVRNIESRIIAEAAGRRDAPKGFAGLFRPSRFTQGAAASRDHENGHAFAILEKAGLLRETGLIEAIKHRMQTHRLTLALRRLRRESSIASLMEDSQSSIIQSLLVSPAPESVDQLKSFIDSESDRKDAFQYPLIRPVDLPPSVMKQLCWWIAAALRQYANSHADIVSGSVDSCFEQATKAVLDRLGDESAPASEAEGVIGVLIAGGRFSPDLLLQLLSQGEVSLFEAGFAKITGLRKILVSRLLYETGGESLAVACKAAGFDTAGFATIYGYTRHGQLTADPVPAENQDIVDFYEDTEQDDAEAVLERWRHDGDFLYAIKLLKQAEDNTEAL